MTDNPLVTCCIPSYNHHQFIEKAIYSVINQSYDKIELLIIDDGSIDSSVQVIERLRDVCEKRFVNYKFISRENRGLSRTLNEMIGLASGHYITLLASDDSFMPFKIEFLLRMFDSLSENYAGVFGDAEIVYEGNKNEFKEKSFFSRYYREGELNSNFDVTYKDILTKNFIPAMSILYKKDALNQAGLFTETLRLEDWDIYLKLLHNFKFKGINTPVAYYYLHGENSIFTENERLLNDTITILKREKKFSLNNGLKDIWYERYYDSVINLAMRERNLKKSIRLLLAGNIATAVKYCCKKIANRFR